MKVARFVLKIVATSLAVAAAVCAVVAYWDKIVELFGMATEKVSAKTKSFQSSEYDDYEE